MSEAEPPAPPPPDPSSDPDAAEPASLATLLRARYGLAVERLEPAPRGWTGQTYHAVAADGRRSFVKLFRPGFLPPTALPALPVLVELRRLGLAELSSPIPTTDGALHARLGDDVVVLFDYVDGARLGPPFVFGGERLGGLLARLHALSDRVALPLARESFDRPDGRLLWRTLARAREEPAVDEAGRALRRFVDERGRAIEDDWATLGELASVCRSASPELVLTHGDWPFNLMAGADGAVRLVDWDELMLAPAERDTWFAGGDQPFWRAYHAGRPGHRECEPATAFYLYGRYFEDLVGSMRVILGDLHVGNAALRARSAAGLDGTWIADLRAWLIGRQRRRPS